MLQFVSVIIFIGSFVCMIFVLCLYVYFCTISKDNKYEYKISPEQLPLLAPVSYA